MPPNRIYIFIRCIPNRLMRYYSNHIIKFCQYLFKKIKKNCAGMLLIHCTKCVYTDKPKNGNTNCNDGIYHCIGDVIELILFVWYIGIIAIELVYIFSGISVIVFHCKNLV